MSSGTERHPASRQSWPGSQYIRCTGYHDSVNLFYGEVGGTSAKGQNVSPEERKELLEVTEKKEMANWEV